MVVAIAAVAAAAVGAVAVVVPVEAKREEVVRAVITAGDVDDDDEVNSSTAGAVEAPDDAECSLISSLMC